MTKAASIKLSNCHTWFECHDAIDRIERDWRNVVGGLAAWNSGEATQLTATAAAKVKALKAKACKLTDGEENFQ